MISKRELESMRSVANKIAETWGESAFRESLARDIRSAIEAFVRRARHSEARRQRRGSGR